ncbi:MAG TPA: hypothetical protein VGO40_15535 [Longimicrobium sp.]|jgi:hypothetical protein|nr:hypothetical protein [Longimicrobium sp.]
MKSVDLSQSFLGPLDADDDENLRKYYVQFGDFSALREKRKFLVVGAKGTGKSAIKKYLQVEREGKNEPAIMIDGSYSLPLAALQTTSPAEITNKMKAFITGAVIQNLLESAISSAAKAKLKAFRAEVPFIEWLLRPLTIKIPFIEYAISELFPPEKRSALMRVISPEVITAIKSAMGRSDCWILVDDIDRVFTSDDESISFNFIEGLILAASDLNIRVFAGRVFVVLLLRSEVYDRLSPQASELDKKVLYVWELSWGSDELRTFIARRVQWALEADPELEDWVYWSYLFDVDSIESAHALQDYVISRVINGPRDLLLLVDYARKLAWKDRARRITRGHIEESEYKFGETKLKQLAANFSHHYPGLHDVVERLFRRAKASYTPDELDEHINEHLLTNPEAMKSFRDLHWLPRSTAFTILQILYRVGIIGYQEPRGRRYVFVLEDTAPEKRLAESSCLVVHPAFARFLQLQR